MSIQPRKERRQLHHLALHARRQQVRAHLSEELLVKYGQRTVTVRAGDTVRVIRGGHKGTTGKVVAVNTSDFTVTVDGVTVPKADGTQKPKPVHPSNLLVTKLDLTDRSRRESLGAVLSAEEERALEEERDAKRKEKEDAKRRKEEAAEAPEAEEAEEPEEERKEEARAAGEEESRTPPEPNPPSEMEEEHIDEEEER